MFDLLEKRCPKLRKITFHFGRPRSPISRIGDLTKFIRCCKSLRSISLTGKFPATKFNDDESDDSESVDEYIIHAGHYQYELLNSLALCNGLEELELNPDLEPSRVKPLFSFQTFHMVLRDIEQQPFMGLRKLNMVIDPRSTTILPPKLNPNSLATLDLKIRGGFFND